jgi:hypothetical protein
MSTIQLLDAVLFSVQLKLVSMLKLTHQSVSTATVPMDLSTMLLLELVLVYQDFILIPPKHLPVSLAQLSTVMSVFLQTPLNAPLARLELLLTLSVKHVPVELVSISMEHLAVNVLLSVRIVVLPLLPVLHVLMLLVET